MDEREKRQIVDEYCREHDYTLTTREVASGAIGQRIADAGSFAIRELGQLRGAVGDYLAAIDATTSRKSPARTSALERLRKAYGGGA